MMNIEKIVKKAVAKVSPAVGKEVKKKTDKVAKGLLSTALDVTKYICLGIVLVNGIMGSSETAKDGVTYIFNHCNVTIISRK